MAEMINKDTAVERISNAIWHLPNEAYPRFNNFDTIHAVVKDAVKGIPADERLDIILCSECVYYGRADKRRFYRGYDCLKGRIASIVPDKDFCSRAERRGESDG